MRLTRWLPTEAWVRLAIVPALVFIATAVDQQYLVDFWHHLARGRAIVNEGRLLNHDVFTFTVAGEEFRDNNWLTQVAYFHLYTLGGLELVRLFNSLTLAVTFLLLVLLCWRRCGSLAIASATGIFVFLGSWQVLTVRPQTFSLLIFVLAYGALELAPRRPWPLLAPPLLVALWANVHGAFPAGVLLVGCYWLAAIWTAWRTGSWREQNVWLLAACLLASLTATLANPYGWEIYQYVATTSQRAAERGIIEWLPPTFDLLITWAGALSVVSLAALYALRWSRYRKAPSALDVCLILCFLPPALRSVRMIVWWLFVIAPAAADVLSKVIAAGKPAPAGRSRPSLAAAAMFALILMACVFSAPGVGARDRVLGLARHEGPHVEAELEEVCACLRAQAPPGRLFTRFEWGEYVDWTAHPTVTVFMDGRTEIYPDRIWNDYVAISEGRKGWDRLLDAYRVDYILLDVPYHSQTGLLQRLKQSPRWRRGVCVGANLVLYVREREPFALTRQP